MLLKTLLAVATINLISCAQRQDAPPFPDIEVCRIVWTYEPYCRCVSVKDPNLKTSYPKEECNVSLRPGGWALVMEYTKELRRKLDNSQKKWIANVNGFAKE